MKTFVRALVSLMLAGLAAATPVGAQDSATIMLLLGIPDTDVDVLAGGEAAVEDFSFGDMQDLSALAGQTLPGLQVVLAGTDTVAIDAGDTALPASGNFTIVAHLDADGEATISVFENDVSATAAGQGRLVVRHTAAAPAVDVRAGGAVALGNVVNGGEGQLDLDAGTISADVVPAGADEPVVIGPADLPVAEGSSLIVYAVGSLDGGTLTVLTESITGLGETPTEVPSGNSPVENGFPMAAVALGLIAAMAAAGGLTLARKSN